MHKLEFTEYTCCEDCGDVYKTTFVCPICQRVEVARFDYLTNDDTEFTCSNCTASFVEGENGLYNVVFDADKHREIMRSIRGD